MSELRLPEELEGPWEHLLMLTFGADFPFFEHALMRQLAGSCRNKVILADGREFLETCAANERSGMLRHLNQRYIGEGLFLAGRAHAKLILLTSQEQGRLLVGSGNLSMQGFASGGELFTRYRYTADEPSQLNAFLEIRDLIERLLEERYVDGAAARRHVRLLLDHTPWLYRAPADTWRPVRHNLGVSFLRQITDEVGDESVEELWIHSPFFDPEAAALKELLDALRPLELTLLVQDRHTSIRRERLQNVLDHYPGRWQVRAIRRQACGADEPWADAEPFIHAKLLLIKLADRAICVQGSPNVTRAAMLKTPPDGNIELANLLLGARDSFDEVLRCLHIDEPVTNLDMLTFNDRDEDILEPPSTDGWRLKSGEWHEHQLDLTYRGHRPNLEGAFLCIGEYELPMPGFEDLGSQLRIRLPEEWASVLGGGLVAVRIQWKQGDALASTNPIFVCNRSALEGELQRRDDTAHLHRTGDLDLEDEELEKLLQELEEALVFDRRSAWQLAGRAATLPADDEDAPPLSYADVDYNVLRAHPKLRQYFTVGSGDAYSRTRLQTILDSITQHFRSGTLPPEVGHVVGELVETAEDAMVETEEEREALEEDRQRRRQSSTQRTRRMWRRFIMRYVRGIRSPDFRELVGYAVMTVNYRIFTHILWLLLGKDWVESGFIVDALLQIWCFFWGDPAGPGYFDQLEPEERQQALNMVAADDVAHAVFVASLYQSATVTRTMKLEELRFRLRDFLRTWCTHPPVAISEMAMELAWREIDRHAAYDAVRPLQIVDALEQLLGFETRANFLSWVEARYHLPTNSCRFERHKVRRRLGPGEEMTECLVIKSSHALTTIDDARTVIAKWLQAENRDYYRVHCPDPVDRRLVRRMCYYDTQSQQGLYWDASTSREQYVGPPEPEPAPWSATVDKWRRLAQAVDATHTMETDVAHVTSGVT